MTGYGHGPRVGEDELGEGFVVCEEGGLGEGVCDGEFEEVRGGFERCEGVISTVMRIGCE